MMPAASPAGGRLPHGCGRSSGVEHDLAKVGVEGSNPFARSKNPLDYRGYCTARWENIRQQSAERNTKMSRQSGKKPGSLFTRCSVTGSAIFELPYLNFIPRL